MDENEKRVVAADLCARMPYGAVNALYAPAYDSAHEIRVDGLTFDELGEFINPSNVWMKNIISIRPYLRPLTTMTDEEKKELASLFVGYSNPSVSIDTNWGSSICWDECSCEDGCEIAVGVGFTEMNECIMWLDRKMFDHRKIRKDGKLMTLIDAGLALPATEKMYNGR